ncbi:hypothetical protein Tco_0033741 [Tanacetum coccineum]
MTDITGGNYVDAIDRGFARALQLDPNNVSVRKYPGQFFVLAFSFSFFANAAEQKLRQQRHERGQVVTAIFSGELHLGVMLQGKRIRDDNKTLLQTGIWHDNVLDVLGFTLVSNELQEGITVTDMTSYGLPCARKVVAVELEVSNVKTTVTGVGSFTFSRMRQELTRLPSPRQTDKANRYAAKDNDDFISSESDWQTLLISRSNNTNASRTSIVAFPRDPSKNTQSMHVDTVGAKSKRGTHVIVAKSPPTKDDAMEV